MKILSIGNSYSADAHRWLSAIAKMADFRFAEMAGIYHLIMADI